MKDKRFFCIIKADWNGEDMVCYLENCGFGFSLLNFSDLPDSELLLITAREKNEKTRSYFKKVLKKRL